MILQNRQTRIRQMLLSASDNFLRFFCSTLTTCSSSPRLTLILQSGDQAVFTMIDPVFPSS